MHAKDVLYKRYPLARFNTTSDTLLLRLECYRKPCYSCPALASRDLNDSCCNSSNVKARVLVSITGHSPTPLTKEVTTSYAHRQRDWRLKD
ncbi:hypothetical protein AVEN_225202-1 [Araneus ventricosus]|uniref:Uncharacterized protein n=1 Tax=Araneus ventricosus TaxID=182803 RepID=A0A4Y2AMP8_ARAVE|nr:hypothetical protein AVEN_225202-1 [Araneus ventricosus]